MNHEMEKTSNQLCEKNREKNIANYSAICNTIIHIIYIDNTPGE